MSNRKLDASEIDGILEEELLETKTEEDSNLTPKEEWIKKNKAKAGYSQHKVLWEHIRDDLDTQKYDKILAALNNKKKQADPLGYDDVISNKIKGYWNDDVDIFKDSLPQSFKEANFKARFPKKDKQLFLQHVITAITTMTPDNFAYAIPLAFMAKFGIDKDVMTEWINDPELKTTAEDTHEVITMRELWDIYKIKYDHTLAILKLREDGVNDFKMPSTAMDPNMGMSKLAEDETYGKATHDLDFESKTVLATDDKEFDWDEIEEDLNDKE